LRDAISAIDSNCWRSPFLIKNSITTDGIKVYGTRTRFTELRASQHLFSRNSPIGAIARIVSDTELELSVTGNEFTRVEFFTLISLGTIQSINSDQLLSLAYTSPVALTNSEYAHSTQTTTFDVANTLFYSNRDKFRMPEEGDKYVIYPQLGVYK
jgi:hypothetical protein